MSRDIAHEQWRFSIVSMSTWCLGQNISETVRDKTCVQRTSNGKWPIASLMVTWLMTSCDPEMSMSWLVTSICLVPIITKMAGDRLGDNAAPIGNGHVWIKWSLDRWRHVIQKGQGRNPICLVPIVWKRLDGDLVTVYSRFPDGYFPGWFFPRKDGWSFSRRRQFLMINLQAHT